MAIDLFKEFQDCVLHIYDSNDYIGPYEVHRHILAQQSDYFNMIFTRDDHSKFNEKSQLEFEIHLPFCIKKDIIVYILKSFYEPLILKTFDVMDCFKVMECLNYFLMKYERQELSLCRNVIDNIFNRKIEHETEDNIVDFILRWISLGYYLDGLIYNLNTAKVLFNIRNNDHVDKFSKFIETYSHNNTLMKHLLAFIMISVNKEKTTGRYENIIEDITEVIIFLIKINMPRQYIEKLKLMFGYNNDNVWMSKYDNLSKLYINEKPDFPDIDYSHQTSKGIYVSKIYYNNPTKSYTVGKYAPIKSREKIKIERGSGRRIILNINNTYVSIPLCNGLTTFVTIIVFDILLDEPLIIKRVYAMNKKDVPKDYPYYHESINEINDNIYSEKIIYPAYDYMKSLTKWAKFNVVFEVTE